MDYFRAMIRYGYPRSRERISSIKQSTATPLMTGRISSERMKGSDNQEKNEPFTQLKLSHKNRLRLQGGASARRVHDERSGKETEIIYAQHAFSRLEFDCAPLVGRRSGTGAELLPFGLDDGLWLSIERAETIR